MSHDEDLFKPGCRKCRLPEGSIEDQIEEMRRVAAFGGAVVILFVVALLGFVAVCVARAFA